MPSSARAVVSQSPCPGLYLSDSAVLVGQQQTEARIGVHLPCPHASGSYLSLEAPTPLKKAPHWTSGAPNTTLSQPHLAAWLLCPNCLPLREGRVRQRPQAGHCAGPLASQKVSGSSVMPVPVPTESCASGGGRCGSRDCTDKRIIVTQAVKEGHEVL